MERRIGVQPGLGAMDWEFLNEVHAPAYYCHYQQHQASTSIGEMMLTIYFLLVAAILSSAAVCVLECKHRM